MVEEILILTVLFDLGSEVLRDVMLQLLQPNTLTETFQSNKSKIDELYKGNKISPHDYDLLKQLPPQPEKFNIYLLINILTQFCPGVNLPPAGWSQLEQLPVPTDSLGADIQRLEWLITIFLGKYFSTMTDEDVEKTWNEVETVLVGISKHGSKKITNIHERIEARKTSKLKAVQVGTLLTFLGSNPFRLNLEIHITTLFTSLMVFLYCKSILYSRTNITGKA